MMVRDVPRGVGIAAEAAWNVVHRTTLRKAGMSRIMALAPIPAHLTMQIFWQLTASSPVQL